MNTSTMLTNAAVVFVVLAVWSDLKIGGRLRPSQRTWLLVAVIFAVVSIVLGFS